MSGATIAESRGRSASHSPEIPRAPLLTPVGLRPPTHLYLPAASAIRLVFPSAARARPQRDTSRRARAPLAADARLHRGFLSPYYRAGRYASQGEYAPFYLQH